jgi:Photosynthesis system II assembly factor YCF48/Secretion system C-terminal sorting domain
MIRQTVNTFLFIILYSLTIYSQGWFLQNPLPQGNNLYDLHIFDSNTTITVGRYGTILKTIDSGMSWNSKTSGATEELRSVYFTDNNTGWAVGDVGTILKTIDGGTNWTFQTSGTTKNLRSVHFTNNDTGWTVGERGTILKTTDGGTNWNFQTIATTNYFNSVHFTDNNTGWAVGFNVTNFFGIILKTTDGGINWNSQTSGSLVTNSVYFTDNNTGWAVGTGGTILKTTDGGVTFIEDENNFTQPKDFLLSQNYPNPFNPSTSIQYAVSSLPTGQAGRQFVVLKVYDVLGIEVATLVNEEKAAGSYEVKFNGEGLTSGIYFYQLRAGDFIETKKMVLVR